MSIECLEDGILTQYIGSSIDMNALVISAIGSFFGALGAAIALWKIEESKNNEKTLTKINGIIAILIAHINSLLNIKRQYIIPMQQEFEDVIIKLKNPEKFVQDGVFYLEIVNIFKHLVETEYRTYDLLENISSFAHKDSKALLLAIKVQESLDYLSKVTKIRNDSILKIQEDPLPKSEKIRLYLGQKEIDGRTEETFTTSTNVLISAVDTSIHFIDILIPRVQKIGADILPKKLSKKIIKNNVADEYKALIPPKDFIKGFED